VSPCFSLYASLGADKDEGSEGAAVGALHALVPFDLSAALRAEEREDQQQGQSQARSPSSSAFAQTEPAPFHPLGMSGSERVILSRVGGQVPKDEPVPAPAGAAGEESEEARTDAALSAFIEDMDALPEPRSPSKGAAAAATKGAGRLFGDDLLFPDAPPAPGATSSPRVYHPALLPAEQRRQDAMVASVSLARRVELSRRTKEATLEHRKLTRAFLAGRLSRPPPSLESVLARLGLGPDGDGASGGEGGSLLEGPSMLPPTRAEIDATTGMSARFRSGPVLPSSTSMGAVLDTSAAALVAHQHELDSSTGADADGQGQERRRHRPPVLHFAFQPVPFGKRALPMRAPTVFGPPDDIDELYRHLNARMGLPSGADASSIAGAGAAPSGSEFAHPSTAASTHSATDMSDSRWMDSVRARLWAASDAALRRRRQVQRAMVGPARERVVHQLRGSVVGEHDDVAGAAGEQSATAAKVKHARRPASAAGAFSPDADPADTSARAMHKLELYAKMRREQQRHAHATQQARVAVQAQAQIRTTASNVRAGNTAAESPRGQSSLLERLRAHDAVLRDAQMDAAQAQQQSVPGSNSAPIARSAAYMLVEFQRKQAALAAAAAAAAAAEAMDAPVRLGSSGGASASGPSGSALVPHPPSRSQPRPSSAVSSRTAHATVGSVMRTSQRSSGSARPPATGQ
jgi:hypothetical protein